MWVVSCPQFSFLWKQCPVPTHGVFHPWPTLHVGDNIFFLILYWSKMPSVTTQGGICWVELWQKASLLSTLSLNLTFSSYCWLQCSKTTWKKKIKNFVLCLFCYFMSFLLLFFFFVSFWDMPFFIPHEKLCWFITWLNRVYVFIHFI